MTIATTPQPAEPGAASPAPTTTPPPGPRFVFAVFGTDQSDKVGELIQNSFPDDDTYKLPSGDWLVADLYKQPSKIYDRILGDNADQISVIVAKVDRVYGLHDVAVWDWIESKKNGVS